ncbi:Tubulin-tyrosine ligase/Tubulin polyglutamylase [Trypanosoma melophagium]|uniref:Tubulin-tyrosine ligase/Tubulin polyglutamylase n=1 Tax=Trypanosoma melophagium TaxID=715481 RepID=UPI00351A35F4|nr:Tubulin-tyrosine ligase/Tubulin polyglutamylase [Trypanosoma melophagium]
MPTKKSFSQLPRTSQDRGKSTDAHLKLPIGRGLRNRRALKERRTTNHNNTGECNVTVDRPPRLFAVMQNIGSLYEEMARQLISTGVWKGIPVKRSHGSSGGLCLVSNGSPMNHEGFALLLGEKIPAEKFVATRRLMFGRTEKPCSKKVDNLNLFGQKSNTLVVNCVESLRCITLKGSMVSTLLEYYSYSWEQLGKYLPRTFRVFPRKPQSYERDQLIETLQNKSYRDTLWIAKSSSGCHGDDVEIFRSDTKGLKGLLRYVDTRKESYMWVVQLYIDRPLLYHRRKFDIRCCVLLCADQYEIYVHEELVMRMSSVEYRLHSATARTAEGRLAHITNHCVQAEGENFSAFEESNELWKEHLDAVIRYKGKRMLGKGIMHDGANPDLEPSLKNTVLPQIHHIIVETLLAARSSIPGERSPSCTPCFQLFGYDFLIDERLRVWLLEINGSPGTAERMITTLVADTIEIVLMPIFPDTTKSAIHQKRLTKRNGYLKLFP